MSNFGGPNSAFEKDMNARIKTLTTKLKKIEDELYSSIFDALKNPKSSKAYWSKVEQDISNKYADLKATFDKWAEQEIPLAFRRDIRNINKRVKSIRNIITTAKLNPIELIHSQPSAQVMGLLLDNAINDFTTALTIGKKNVLKFTRATRQKLISDRLIDLEVSANFIEAGNLNASIDGVSSALVNAGAKLINERHFVQAGKYKYTTNYYAEMVARVKFHEAQAHATLLTCNNYNTDLVQISSHNTTTAICSYYEGKIFSVSGKDTRFPILDMTPPFHPNCLHLMYPTFEEALKVNKTLDDFSKFSLGKATKPPVPAGFVPLSARTLK